MPDLKISQLPAASTPLAGTELVPVVQGGITEQTPVQSLLTSTVPSGTANGVMYLNGSKVATTGSGLTFDGSNLGIGTSSPVSALGFGESASATGVTFQSTNTTFNSGKVAVIKAAVTGSGNGSMVFETYAGGSGGGERMRLDASGNLGLGVTPFSGGTGWKTIDIASYAAYAQRASGSSDAVMSWNAYIVSGSVSSGTGYRYKISGDIASAYEQNGAHRWYTAPSGTAGNAITFTQAMTLDASGNLLVGGTGETYRISAIKNTATSGLETNFIATNQTDSNLAISVSGSAASDKRARIGTVSNTALTFATADTERMRLDASGNLGLGVTPSAWHVGWRGLQVGGSAALWSSASGIAGTYLSNNNYFNGTNRVYILNGTAAEYAQLSTGAHVWYTAPSGTAGNAISFTQAMTLDASGQLMVGTTSAAGAGITNKGTYFARSADEGSVASLSADNGGATTLSAYKATGGVLTFVTANTSGSNTERARIDSAGNFIHQVNGTAPSLSTNSTMSFELTSNTSLKIVVRGTDGVTRSASLTLA